SYRLEAADVVDAQRVNAFRTDPRLPIDQNPSCDDYAGSGFDRGHTVPRSDMNRSLTAMVNTFFLTNMTPPASERDSGCLGSAGRLGPSMGEVVGLGARDLRQRVRRRRRPAAG